MVIILLLQQQQLLLLLLLLLLPILILLLIVIIPDINIDGMQRKAGFHTLACLIFAGNAHFYHDNFKL